jgi:YHS domain-containing protein
MAFIFADLIVLPIIAIYIKYYGRSFALRITALMFLTMVSSALIIDLLFGAAALIPSGGRPTKTDIFSTITVNYKLFLNLAGLAVFAALLGLTARRGETDPVCGMTVDRGKALTTVRDGETLYFCSAHCLHAFQAEPEHNAQAAKSGPERDSRATPTPGGPATPQRRTVGVRPGESYVEARRASVSAPSISPKSRKATS